jgi:hypothetical protein
MQRMLILLRYGTGFCSRLHRDEQGAITLMTVFAVLLLTMLLGMIMNVGRHADAKIRLQNAADSVALSGGTVLAREMNTLAFSNHLLCEIFALTAFYREAEARHANHYAATTLKAWDKAGGIFRGSGFTRWQRLGEAIPNATRQEQHLIDAFSDWAAASAKVTLPILESVLERQMISEFQRAVVEAYPNIAQTAALRVAERGTNNRYGRVIGVLWQTNAVPVGFHDQSTDLTLPVVDPERGTSIDQGLYQARARKQRRQLAEFYLGIVPRRGTRFSPTWYNHTSQWTDEVLWMFDNVAKMSQYGNWFRQFACGQLEQLLEKEYPDSNLPYQIARSNDEHDAGRLDPNDNNNDYLERYYTFVGVAYRKQLPSLGWTQLFRGPLGGDSIAYAEVRMFTPKPRLVWWIPPPKYFDPGGGMPGEPLPIPPNDGGSDSPDDRPAEETRQWIVTHEPGASRSWSLLNQYWRVQLVPAVGPCLPTILQTTPPVPEFANEGLRLPGVGGLSADEMGRISTH